MAKDLSRVIEDALEIIPEDQEDLIASLNDIATSVSIAPPEMMNTWWFELINAMNSLIPEECYQDEWVDQLKDLINDNKEEA